LKSTLSKLIESSEDWKIKLASVQFVINNSLNKAIDSTPSKLLLGYDQKNNNDKILRKLIDNLREVDFDFDKERENERNIAQSVNRRLQEYNKKQYDKRHKRNRKYKEGDLVLVRVTQHKPGTNTKLAPKYKGPYRIKAVLNKNRYAIADVPGYNITQKPLNTIMSPDKLKPWIRI
jgi:hypothetical protein